MFRRRAEAVDPRDAAWAGFAANLGLVPFEGPNLDAWLETIPPEEQPAGVVWTNVEAGDLTVYAYDAQPVTSASVPVRPPRPVVIVRDAKPVETSVAFRAFARSHPLLAQLEAGRSGGRELTTGVGIFDERVGIVAREEELAGLLAGERSAALRVSLIDVLAVPDGIEAALVVTTGHVAWRAQRPVEPPFDALEEVTVGMLGVAVALRVAAASG